MILFILLSVFLYFLVIFDFQFCSRPVAILFLYFFFMILFILFFICLSIRPITIFHFSSAFYDSLYLIFPLSLFIFFLRSSFFYFSFVFTSFIILFVFYFIFLFRIVTKTETREIVRRDEASEAGGGKEGSCASQVTGSRRRTRLEEERLVLAGAASASGWRETICRYSHTLS